MKSKQISYKQQRALVEIAINRVVFFFEIFVFIQGRAKKIRE